VNNGRPQAHGCDPCEPYDLHPSLDGYRRFLYEVANFPLESLPPTSFIIPVSLGIACEVVNHFLRTTPRMYMLAVYNLATDRLINYAQDIPGQTFFQDLRKKYKISNSVAVAPISPTVGVVTTTFDNGSGVTLATPETLKNLTLSQLQNLQTPFGAAYIGIASSVGPTLWGLS
jgi:hypothetical protein